MMIGVKGDLCLVAFPAHMHMCHMTGPCTQRSVQTPLNVTQLLSFW